MTRFVVESDFLKLASSVASSSLLALWNVMRAVGEVTQVGADVRRDVAEPVKWNRESVCVRCRVCERGLPEQERRTAGGSSGVSQDIVGSTSMREEQEPSSGRNHCIDGSNRCNLIHTLGMRNDEGHGEGRARDHTDEGKQ
jgi:hypothetical protein